MPPMERFGRVADDHRLRGIWLRTPAAEHHWYAPGRLPDGAWAMCAVELRMEPDPTHRHTYWGVLTRQGQALAGDFDLPAVSYRQALAAVERALSEAGVALDGRDGP